MTNTRVRIGASSGEEDVGALFRPKTSAAPGYGLPEPSRGGTQCCAHFHYRISNAEKRP